MTPVIGRPPAPRKTRSQQQMRRRKTEDAMKKLFVVALPLLLAGGAAIGACVKSMNAGQGQLLGLAQARNLSPEDAARAIKTFVPPGGRDEYLLFASGGHSGQVHVIGVPSMRLLKTGAVFTPGPWRGVGKWG